MSRWTILQQDVFYVSGWPTLTPMHCNLHWLSFQMSHQIDQLIECIVTLVATVHLCVFKWDFGIYSQCASEPFAFVQNTHFSCQKGQPGSVTRSVIQCSLDRTEPSKAFARNSRKCHKCYICEVSHLIANRAFLFNSNQKILLQ